MSSRALRKLQGSDLELPVDLNDQEDESDEGSTPAVVQSVKSKNKKKKPKAENVNPFELLNVEEEVQSADENEKGEPVQNGIDENADLQADTKKKKKKKKKKGKDKITAESSEGSKPDEDEIDASVREVNRILNVNTQTNITDQGGVTTAELAAFRDVKGLLTVEHKHLNPDTEMKRIFGSRVIQAEQTRRRMRTRGRQRATWMSQPTDSWPPIGKTGLTMSHIETKNGCQYFTYEHNHQYQQVQFQFYDAVESLNPNNIGNILQQQPYHIDALIQLSEVFRMSDDMQMAAELIERALYGLELAFHPLFSLTTGTCRLDFRRPENRSFYLALFKHLVSIGQKGCNRTALEFCKLLLSLDPDDDPMCVLLMIDFYALRAKQNEFIIRMYSEWEAHRNLSQLPNFAYSVPLAMFHKNTLEDKDLKQADELLQNALLMFPGVLTPLLDKCSIQPDASVTSHSFFKTTDSNASPEALRQLTMLYVGRCYSCWKEPEVVEWLERNVQTVIERVDKKDPLVEEYRKKRQMRYRGTPRNIYRHIIISEIPDATTTLPQDIASTVLSYDPLPPTDSVVTYTRPNRPPRAQTDGNALTMFLRSLLPNYNPNEPAAEDEGAVGGTDGNSLRQGVGALMEAMRELLHNIQPVSPPIENPQDGDGEEEQDFGEWD